MRATRSYAKRETGSDRVVQLAGSKDLSKVMYSPKVELVSRFFHELSINIAIELNGNIE